MPVHGHNFCQHSGATQFDDGYRVCKFSVQSRIRRLFGLYRGMDAPFPDEEPTGLSGLLAVRDRVLQISGKKNPTVADFVEFSARGTIKDAPTFVGAAT